MTTTGTCPLLVPHEKGNPISLFAGAFCFFNRALHLKANTGVTASGGLVKLFLGSGAPFPQTMGTVGSHLTIHLCSVQRPGGRFSGRLSHPLTLVHLMNVLQQQELEHLSVSPEFLNYQICKTDPEGLTPSIHEQRHKATVFSIHRQRSKN